MSTPLTKIDGGKASPNWHAETFPKRILELYRRMGYMQKGGHNKAMSYNFLQEAEVKRRLNEDFRDLGIVIVQVRMRPLAGSTPAAAVVRCRLVVSDAWVSDQSKGLVNVVWEGVGGDQDKTGKAVMKACAAAFKYAVTSGCMVSTGDDPESNEEAEESAIEDLRQRIDSAETPNALNLLKPEVSDWKKHPEFEDLKAAFRARMEALQGGASKE